MLLDGLNITTKDKIPVILLFGPTAVGKTELLLELFKGRGEVINADSMQVYKGLDVGSAKPTPQYVKEIPHHLISIIQPQIQFSVADFVREADVLTEQIYNKNLIPVISGGTAFYFKNFIYGLPKLPEISKETRDNIQLELKKTSLEHMYNKLKEIDPKAAKEINPCDTYRVTRALEVFIQSCKSILDCKQPTVPRDRYNFLIIGLERPRVELYERINQRVDIMFSDGLLEEFKHLYSMGLNPTDPGMKGIGYSEFFQMMASGCWSIEELKEEIRRNSRRYAKRQITFFNSFVDVHWVNPQKRIELIKIVDEFLKKNSLES
ncbi:MAG: tRNA (adenosine(37)-N6)-dimethylallyltransferase MiaA [Spirochaetaceae bacterium]